MTYDEAMRHIIAGLYVERPNMGGEFKIGLHDGKPFQFVKGEPVCRYFPGSFDAYANDWRIVHPLRFVTFIAAGLFWVALAVLLWWMV